MPEPSDAIACDQYRCGWNDTEYGINHWTGSEIFKNPLQWAISMKEAALFLRGKPYHDGVIDCVTQYQETGNVERKERLSTMELNACYKS